MKITCKEAQTLCDKGQYKETNFIEKVKLTIHHFVCKKCKEYSTQNVFLSLLLKKCKDVDQLTNQCLSKEEKVELQNKVEKELQTNTK